MDFKTKKAFFRLVEKCSQVGPLFDIFYEEEEDRGGVEFRCEGKGVLALDYDKGKVTLRFIVIDQQMLGKKKEQQKILKKIKNFLNAHKTNKRDKELYRKLEILRDYYWAEQWARNAADQARDRFLQFQGSNVDREWLDRRAWEVWEETFQKALDEEGFAGFDPEKYLQELANAFPDYDFDYLIYNFYINDGISEEEVKEYRKFRI